jgi:hypothetical protein
VPSRCRHPEREITAAGKPIGTLGSVVGHGLAIVRIDRAGEAMASGTPLLAGDVPVSLACRLVRPGVPAAADEASA